MSAGFECKRIERYGRIAAAIVAGFIVALPTFARGDGVERPDIESLSPSRPAQATQTRAGVFPSAPPGVTDLAFRDFYKLPVGRYGLEPTDKLVSLEGRQVRILGCMVRRQRPVPGTFILSPVPVTMAEEADGEADDLPPAIVFVQMPEDSAHLEVNGQRGLFLLTGTLSLGAREEVDGRISFVRLRLAPPASGDRAAAEASTRVNAPAQ